MLSQINSNTKYVDEFAVKVKADNAIDLAWRLQGPFVNNMDKVRAIYRWITENIAYDVKNYTNENIYSIIEYPNLYSKDELNDSIYSHLIADFVIDRKMAICDGYSRLFKTLCDYSNIPCKIIHGYANNQSFRNLSNEEKKENHAWNAVYVNKKWHLIDVTWASGYCDDNIQLFTRELNDNYFFSNPIVFATNHTPSNPTLAYIK
jgi:transglutaminase/protease-like cytokinesis protein 3